MTVLGKGRKPVTLEDQAREASAAWQRCPNYPRDESGLKALAHGLVRASEITHVSIAAIVERCCAESTFCPTDAELISTAKAIRGSHEWQPDYGNDRCPKCDGSGWETVYRMKTEHSEMRGGQAHNWVEWQAMTKAEYDAWNEPKRDMPISRLRQSAHTAARRCSCGKLPPPPKEAA